MNTKMLLSNSNLLDIKNIIHEELLKKNITAPIIYLKEFIGSNCHYIEFKTEEFQTIPFIFKKLWVANGGSSIEICNSLDAELDKIQEYFKININVHCYYIPFNGRYDASMLFTIHFKTINDKICLESVINNLETN